MSSTSIKRLHPMYDHEKRYKIRCLIYNVVKITITIENCISLKYLYLEQEICDISFFFESSQLFLFHFVCNLFLVFHISFLALTKSLFIEIVTLLLQEVTSALVHIPTYAHLFDKNNVMSSKDCNWWCPAQNIV